MDEMVLDVAALTTSLPQTLSGYSISSYILLPPRLPHVPAYLHTVDLKCSFNLALRRIYVGISRSPGFPKQHSNSSTKTQQLVREGPNSIWAFL